MLLETVLLIKNIAGNFTRKIYGGYFLIKKCKKINYIKCIAWFYYKNIFFFWFLFGVQYLFIVGTIAGTTSPNQGGLEQQQLISGSTFFTLQIRGFAAGCISSSYPGRDVNRGFLLLLWLSCKRETRQSNVTLSTNILRPI